MTGYISSKRAAFVFLTLRLDNNMNRVALSIVLLLLLNSFSNLLFAQDKEKKRNMDFLEFLVEDTYLVAGINRGGIFWSNHYKNLRDGNGYNVGVEAYYPIMNKAFLNFGISFAHHRFSHVPRGFSEEYALEFRNNNLELPLYTSFELPVLRDYDFRFNLGIQMNYRLNTKRINEYSQEVLDADVFLYPIDGRYKNFDAGMLFGLSIERNNCYFRLRSASGLNNFYSGEQGMLHAFYIDFGYFLFRKLRSSN